MKQIYKKLKLLKYIYINYLYYFINKNEKKI